MSEQPEGNDGPTNAPEGHSPATPPERARDQAPAQPAQPPGQPQYGRPYRRPKFGPFLLTGAIVGLLVAMVIDLLGPQVPGYSAGSVLGFIGLSFAALGALLGGVVAALLDRKS